jgi:hypothetical protein
MPSDNLTISEIIRQLPQSLQTRFNSLSRYVQGIIEEEQDNLGRDIELNPEDAQLIQLTAFIYSIDDFLRAGTRAAQAASGIFEEFGSAGFQVGRSHFTSDSDDTLRGEALANGLRDTVASTPLHRYIASASTMQALISALVREMTNDTHLDR